jgi:hypothetical protein
VICKINSCHPSHLSKAGEEGNFDELSVVPGTGVTTGLQYKVAVLLHVPAHGMASGSGYGAMRSGQRHVFVSCGVFKCCGSRILDSGSKRSRIPDPDPHQRN